MRPGMSHTGMKSRTGMKSEFDVISMHWYSSSLTSTYRRVG